MVAEVDSFGPGPALGEGSFCPRAVDLGQPDGTMSLAKVSQAWSCSCCPTAQLPAHHFGVTQVPGIVTHRPPLALLKDFNSPSTAAWAVHQPNHLWF